MVTQELRDLDIRRELLSRLREEHAADLKNTLIIDELGICQGERRVDVAVINGSLAGFEIKSERDTLGRLGRQRDAYELVFDEVTLVVSACHLKAARNVVPKWWGLLVATGRRGDVTLRLQRRPRRNKHTSDYAVAQLLWRDEVLALLEKHSLAAGLRSKPRNRLWQALVDAMDPLELRTEVRDQLRARVWRSGPSPLRGGD
jgi:hypothetical protein